MDCKVILKFDFRVAGQPTINPEIFVPQLAAVYTSRKPLLSVSLHHSFSYTYIHSHANDSFNIPNTNDKYTRLQNLWRLNRSNVF